MVCLVWFGLVLFCAMRGGMGDKREKRERKGGWEVERVFSEIFGVREREPLDGFLPLEI